MKYKTLNSLAWEERFTYIKNIVFNEKDLGSLGAKFQIVKFKPQTKIEPHYHDKVHEIFYIKSGQGQIVFNGLTHQVKADDIFLCQPGDVHAIINNHKEELVILIFKTNEDENDIKWRT